MTKPSPSPLAVKLRPSDSKIWMKCNASPGYVAAHREEIVDVKSVYADEGTAAHDWAAKALVSTDPDFVLDILMDDQVMAAHIRNYVAYVKHFHHASQKLYIETSVPLFYDPSRKGKLDAGSAGVHAPAFGDLKYGQGVSVEADHNPQLTIYAESFIRHLGLAIPPQRTVRLWIHQPRAQDGRDYRDWLPSRDELTAFAADIQTTADSILADPLDQPFRPSESTCQFCKANAICPAYARLALDDLEDLDSPANTPIKAANADARGRYLGLLDDETPQKAPARAQLGPLRSVLSLPDASSLSPEVLGRLLASEGVLKSFYKALGKRAYAMLSNGLAVPGFKLAEGGKHRAWRDRGEALAVLRKLGVDVDVAAPRSLVTPSQAEKLVSKDNAHRLRRLIYRPEGSPTVVPVSDEREEYKIDPAKEFLDLDVDPAQSMLE